MNEAKQLASQLKTLGVNSLVLDTEKFAPCLDLGGLPELNKALGGQYHNLETISAQEVVSHISALLGGG